MIEYYICKHCGKEAQANYKDEHTCIVDLNKPHTVCGHPSCMMCIFSDGKRTSKKKHFCISCMDYTDDFVTAENTETSYNVVNMIVCMTYGCDQVKIKYEVIEQDTNEIEKHANANHKAFPEVKEK